MKSNLSSIKRILISGVALASFAVPAFSTLITIPDGNFSSGFGSVGGGLLNPSATVVIGSGPWSGTYNGALGILAPPTLAISSGAATISGIAGINVAGIVNNSGDFTTTLNSAGSGPNYAYLQNTTYTLTANISAATTLSLNTLTTDGVGIALTNNGVIVASTAISPSLLTVLTTNNYQLSLNYAIGASGGPVGSAIGIELYDIPSGLLTANLIPSVTFSNVTLSSIATPEPAAFILSAAGLLGLGVFEYRRRKAQRSEQRA